MRKSPQNHPPVSPEKLTKLNDELDLILNNFPAFMKKLNLAEASNPDVVSFEPDALAVAAKELREKRKKPKPA